VAAFLERRIAFTDITQLIERALGAEPAAPLASIEACVDVDTRTRRRVSGWIDGRAKG
jgi:1-deoxy-D-xylulose 5-phosphate reductoisomerase